MVCEFCGKQLDSDAIFCPNCGGMVTVKNPDITPNDQKNNKKMIIAIIAVVVAVVLLVGGIFGGITIFKSHDKANKEKYYNGSTMFFTDVNGNELVDYYLEITDDKGINVYEGHHTKDKPYVVSLKDTGNYTFNIKENEDDIEAIELELYIDTSKEKNDIYSIDLPNKKLDNKPTQPQTEAVTISEECKRNLEVVSEYLYKDCGKNMVSEYMVETEDSIYYIDSYDKNNSTFNICQIDKSIDETSVIYTSNKKIDYLLAYDDMLYFSYSFESSDYINPVARVSAIDLNDISAGAKQIVKDPVLVVSMGRQVYEGFFIGNGGLFYFASKNKGPLESTDLLVRYDLADKTITKSELPGNSEDNRECFLQSYNADGQLEYYRNESNVYENEDYIVVQADEYNNIIEIDLLEWQDIDRYIIVDKHTGEAKFFRTNDYFKFYGVHSGKINTSSREDYSAVILDWDDLESVYL